MDADSKKKLIEAMKSAALIRVDDSEQRRKEAEIAEAMKSAALIRVDDSEQRRKEAEIVEAMERARRTTEDSEVASSDNGGDARDAAGKPRR